VTEEELDVYWLKLSQSLQCTVGALRMWSFQRRRLIGQGWVEFFLTDTEAWRFLQAFLDRKGLSELAGNIAILLSIEEKR